MCGLSNTTSAVPRKPTLYKLWQDRNLLNLHATLGEESKSLRQETLNVMVVLRVRSSPTPGPVGE